MGYPGSGRRRVLPPSKSFTTYLPVQDREALEVWAAARGVAVGEVARDVLHAAPAVRRLLAHFVARLRAEEARGWDESDLPPHERGDRLRVGSPDDAARSRLLEEALATYADIVRGPVRAVSECAADLAAARRAAVARVPLVEVSLRADLGLAPEDLAGALGALARAVRGVQVQPDAELPDSLDELEREAVCAMQEAGARLAADTWRLP